MNLLPMLLHLSEASVQSYIHSLSLSNLIFIFCSIFFSNQFIDCIIENDFCGRVEVSVYRFEPAGIVVGVGDNEDLKM